MRQYWRDDRTTLMSIIFQSGVFEYQLPSVVGGAIGSAMVSSNSGVGFSELYSGTCSVNFTGPVLQGCTLTISTCGRMAYVFLTAPSGETLSFDVDNSNPQWGSLVDVNPTIPASLLPSGAAALGMVALLKTAGGAIALRQLYVSLTGTGLAIPAGLISLSAVDPLEAGTYALGGIAQLSLDGATKSVYLGSYLIA